MSISVQNLAAYLRSYHKDALGSLEAWSKQESAGFAPGMLIFCLERVSPLDSSFGDGQEAFRVKDLGICVGADDGRSPVIIVTDNSFELRWLDVLMLEKAQKSVEGQEFLFVIAHPAQALAQSKLLVIEELGANFSVGGSRRSMVADPYGPEEPAIALLAALGVKISQIEIGQQVLDLSSILNMLISPDSEPTDKTKQSIKNSFTAVLNEQPESQRPQPIAPLSAPKEEAQTVASQFKFESDSAMRLEEEKFAREHEARWNAFTADPVPTDLSLKEPEAQPSRASTTQPAPKLKQINSQTKSAAAPGGPMKDPHEDLFKPPYRELNKEPQLPEELTQKLDPHNELFYPLPQSLPTSSPLPPSPAGSQPSLFDRLNEQLFKAPTPQLSNADAGTATKAMNPAPAPTQSAPVEAALAPEQESIQAAPVETAAPMPEATSSLPSVEEVQIAQPASAVETAGPMPEATSSLPPVETAAPMPEPSSILPPVEEVQIAQPASAVETAGPIPEATSILPPVEEVQIDDAESEEEEIDHGPAGESKGFRESRLVMDEMATLTSKLETQVQKAATKLDSRIDEIKNRLNKQVDLLVNDATQLEKDSQQAVTDLAQRLNHQLDEIKEQSQAKISQAAAESRNKVSELIKAHQNRIDESKNTHCESLKTACTGFRSDIDSLARQTESELGALVNQRTEELSNIVQTTANKFNETSQDYLEKIASKFERFKERMSEETSSVIHSMERNVRSLSEDRDGALNRATEQLKAAKTDLEQTVQHTVRTAELSLSQNTKMMLAEALIPKSVERQESLRSHSLALSTRFTEESTEQEQGQIEGLEGSLTAARQQLQTLVEECLAQIDNVGRGQQTGLEEIFKDLSFYAEKNISDVIALLNKMETQITENETVSRKLAKASSIDTEPQLVDERNKALAGVREQKEQAESQLSTALDQSCARLEQLGNDLNSQLDNLRQSEIKAVDETAKNALARGHEALREAICAIQAASDKLLE